jgi:hypothetical protein
MFDDKHYDDWNKKWVVADCLRKYGLNDFAKNVHTPELPTSIIDSYTRLIHEIAVKAHDEDVMERLCLAGLIYG